MTAAEPAHLDDKNREAATQAIYERFCRAVGTGHSRGVDVDQHLLVTARVLVALRYFRATELTAIMVMLFTFAVLACMVIQPNSCPMLHTGQPHGTL